LATKVRFSTRLRSPSSTDVPSFGVPMVVRGTFLLSTTPGGRVMA
jgi:hypothetical protein